jgi:hypothetical protein
MVLENKYGTMWQDEYGMISKDEYGMWVIEAVVDYFKVLIPTFVMRKTTENS